MPRLSHISLTCPASILLPISFLLLSSPQPDFASQQNSPPRHPNTVNRFSPSQPPTASSNLTSMKETSPDGPYINRLRTWARSKVHGGNRGSARRPGTNRDRDRDRGSERERDPSPSLLPISDDPTNSTSGTLASSNNGGIFRTGSRDAASRVVDDDGSKRFGSRSSLPHSTEAHNSSEGLPQPPPSTQAPRKGSQLETAAPFESNDNKNEGTNQEDNPDKPNVVKRFLVTFKKILLYSWLNVLLVFVPVGIIVEFIPNTSPALIFAMNAIAIIPLAGMLSHATETVAHRMGDAIGALMNVTFGNAVELIIL